VNTLVVYDNLLHRSNPCINTSARPARFYHVTGLTEGQSLRLGIVEHHGSRKRSDAHTNSTDTTDTTDTFVNPGRIRPRFCASLHKKSLLRPGSFKASRRPGFCQEFSFLLVHEKFLKFLRQVDRDTPEGMDLHLIVDNYSTHNIPK